MPTGSIRFSVACPTGMAKLCSTSVTLLLKKLKYLKKNRMPKLIRRADVRHSFFFLRLSVRSISKAAQ